MERKEVVHGGNKQISEGFESHDQQYQILSYNAIKQSIYSEHKGKWF